jgi:hypothetical protein
MTTPYIQHGGRGAQSAAAGGHGGAQERLDSLRQMQYLVTAQSHYRAMALLTSDDTNLDAARHFGVAGHHIGRYVGQARQG